MAATPAERTRKSRDKAKTRLAALVGDFEKLPEPPTREHILKIAGVLAMHGNLQAMKLLLEEYRRDGDSDQGSVRSAIDELASRRAAAPTPAPS